MESGESRARSSEPVPESSQAIEPTSRTQDSIAPTSERVNTCITNASGSSSNNKNPSSPVIAMSKSCGGDAAADSDDPVATPESLSQGETVGNTITLRKPELPGPEFKTWSFPWQLCRTWSVSVKRHCYSQPC